MAIGPSSTPSPVPAGLPCWIELACREQAVAERFYGALFGWTYTTQRDPATSDGRYAIATLNTLPVGGLYRAAQGAPLGWMPHLSVPHTASAAEWVEHLGGRLTLGPMPIPQRGTILHAFDACGAPVVFWEVPPDWEFVTGIPNSFSGADLNTHDGVAADHFYTKLFTYGSHQIGDGESLDYVEWLIEHEPVLYRYVMGSEYNLDTPPHWLIYFDIDPARGVDAVAGEAIMNGGTVVIQPYDTPFGRMSILADPEGAVFAVIDHSRVSEDWGRAEVDDPYDD